MEMNVQLLTCVGLSEELNSKQLSLTSLGISMTYSIWEVCDDELAQKT
jgi:hypothetical protein